MPSTQYTDDTELAIAIEEHYAGMVQPHHTTYEVLQPMVQTYSKQTPQTAAYASIARALYTTRPQIAEDSNEMYCYLAGIKALCTAWQVTNPQFDRARFLDLAAIEERDDTFYLLPF